MYEQTTTFWKKIYFQISISCLINRKMFLGCIISDIFIHSFSYKNVSISILQRIFLKYFIMMKDYFVLKNIMTQLDSLWLLQVFLDQIET